MPNPPRIIYQGPQKGAPPKPHRGYGPGRIVSTHSKDQRSKIDRPDQDVQDHAAMANDAPSAQLQPYDGSTPLQTQPQPTAPSPMDELQQFAQNPYGSGGGYGGGGYGGGGYGGGGDDDYQAAIEDDHDAIDAEVEDGMAEDGGDNLAGIVDDAIYQRRAHYIDRFEAYARGRLGFTLDIPVGTNTFNRQVLSVETAAEDAQEWTLTLCAVRYAAGTLNAAFIGDPDHQVASQFFPISNLLKVRIEWGVDGTYEHAVIDYPTRGASISLCAASVRVSIEFTTRFSTTVVPILGGFLTPFGKRQGSDFDAPTLTVEADLAASPGNTPTFVAIPDRARAYRVMIGMTDAQLVGSSQLSVQQVDGLTGATIFSNDGIGTLTPVAETYPSITKTKLHWLAQAIRIANTGTTNPAFTAFVQFDLDLG